jgi:hypothetical protein
MKLQTNRARKRERKQGAAKMRRDLDALPVREPRRRLRPVAAEEWDADVAEILRITREIRALPTI